MCRIANLSAKLYSSVLNNTSRNTVHKNSRKSSSVARLKLPETITFQLKRNWLLSSVPRVSTNSRLNLARFSSCSVSVKSTMVYLSVWPDAQCKCWNWSSLLWRGEHQTLNQSENLFTSVAMVKLMASVSHWLITPLLNRLWASMVLSVRKIWFTKFTLSDLTSNRPATFCGLSNCPALMEDTAKRRFCTMLKVDQLETVKLSSTSLCVKWTSCSCWVSFLIYQWAS